MTRGAPGTHDVSMGINLIQQLKSRQPVQLTIFDKATDDRAPQDKWVTCDSPVDIILFEGWCVGAQAQPPAALTEPCNDLEASEDQDAAWRTFANNQLAGPYTELFALLDRLVMLKAPDFECVYEWRSTQEEKLRKRSVGSANNNIMNDQQIKRFIMHYERITRWMFTEMPQRTDCLLELNQDHNIIQATYADT
ncbi:MAG: kinase [Akkermansiaceae bacterium]